MYHGMTSFLEICILHQLIVLHFLIQIFIGNGPLLLLSQISLFDIYQNILLAILLAFQFHQSFHQLSFAFQLLFIALFTHRFLLVRLEILLFRLDILLYRLE